MWLVAGGAAQGKFLSEGQRRARVADHHVREREWPAPIAQVPGVIGRAVDLLAHLEQGLGQRPGRRRFCNPRHGHEVDISLQRAMHGERVA